jgi:hypothetical protein
MDEEFKKRVADYFTSAELVDHLDIPVEDLVDLIESYLEDNEDKLEDLMTYGL